MATVTTYKLTITQTRPDTNTRWYDRETNPEWLDAWTTFNYYDVETTIDQGLLEGQEPYTTMLAHARISIIIPENTSHDKLTKTLIYPRISEDVYNEFIALLNDDTSGLSAERRYDEAHGITYELTTEEEVQEIEATP
jgi:hypothetical protein